MTFVIIIISLIVFFLFLLVFTLGFFVGLGRKKKELKILQKEQQVQKITQENIIHLLNKSETNGNSHEHSDENILNPIQIITKHYKRLRRYLRYKNLYNKIKEINTIRYFRKYFLSYVGVAVLIFGLG